METVGRLLTIGWVALFLGGCGWLAFTIAPDGAVGWVVVGVLALVWLPLSFAPFAIVATVLGAAMWGAEALRGK